MSFLAELKQRKVFRVGALYLVVAWLAIQVASIAFPAFDAPPWALRVLILLFALGFPLALLLTWALELTPEGIKVASGKVGNKRMAMAATALAALALAWYFLGQPALRQRDSAGERSIAVLPFVNMSGDKANDYFSDGLAETTLDMLAQVADLKVIARTSSFAFKGRNADVREIGKALGAAHLLEGSVQQAGDTVRITAQLIRTRDGVHLWSRRYDRKLADVFAIQDEIANEVVKALQLALPVPEQQRLLRNRTGNVTAYQEYLRGIALLPNRKVPEMRAAAAHFERAIALDPGYARAYVGASDTYHLLAQYAAISAAERERMAHYLDRALELAPDLGEAHVARANYLADAGDNPGAETEYRRGLALAPGYATGNQWFGEFLAILGRFDEALPLLAKAIELDPLSPVIRDVYGFMLGQSGRVDEALALSNRQIAAHPDIARQYDAREALHEQRGDLVAALRDGRKVDELDPEAFGFRANTCHVLIDMGALVEARGCLDDLSPQAAGSATLLFAQARLATIAGNTPGALEILDKIQPPSFGNEFRAYLLLGSGRTAEALAIQRALHPEFFVQPLPTIHPGLAGSAIRTGIALLRTGATGQGRSLLEAGAVALAQRPYLALVAGRGWNQVVAYGQLGDHDRAFALMQSAVDSGFFLLLAELDADPLAAGLRADPRYEKILAPARAMAAAQIEAARKAGVL